MKEPDDLHIEQAKLSDLDTLLAIMDRANQYSIEKSGAPQWTAMDHARGELRTHLEQGNCFVIRHHGSISALVTLTEEDTYAWDAEGTDHTALYFHKLMKDPESPLANLGHTLLTFTAHEALRRDKKLLRCDAKPDMIKLIKYYKGVGFRIKGNFQYKTSGKKGILLEADPQTVLERLQKQT